MKSVIILTIISYVLCQEERFLPPVPDKCLGDTDLLYKNCCVFPPFFTREIAKECGAAMQLIFIDQKNNITGLRRQSFDCDYWRCVLHKYALLERYGDLNLDRYYNHLDVWVGLNPMFGDAMAEAKVFCKENIRVYLPLNACEFYDLHSCIRNYLNVDCPVVIPTKDCLKKKEFFKECRNFYHRK